MMASCMCEKQTLFLQDGFLETSANKSSLAERSAELTAGLSPLTLRAPPLLSSLSPPPSPRRRVASGPSRHGEAAAGGDRHLRQHHGGGRGPGRPQARGTARSPLPFPLPAVEFRLRNLAESARLVADLVAPGRALGFGVELCRRVGGGRGWGLGLLRCDVVGTSCARFALRAY